MRILVATLLTSLAVTTGITRAQSATLKPVHVPAGTVLPFYLQTRLHPADENALDLLPKGTVLNIKILDPIDSDVTRDGAEFHGVIAASVQSGEAVVVHSDAEVRGIFVLLRSRNHPDGFRYELLITGINDGGKNFQLTASLNPSFVDASAQPSSAAAAPKTSTPSITIPTSAPTRSAIANK